MQKMKYKVLAADDEYWSRENLRSLISWPGASEEASDRISADHHDRGEWI